jgi:hypothetical protein|tara:strand:+ start:2400 stop:2954 length:555 start_codon:yes stop_codon:yes gene_type:complete
VVANCLIDQSPGRVLSTRPGKDLNQDAVLNQMSGKPMPTPFNRTVAAYVRWFKALTLVMVWAQVSVAPVVFSAPGNAFDNALLAALSNPALILQQQTADQAVLLTQLRTAQLRAHLETILVNQGWTLIETDRAKKLRREGRLNNLPFVADFIKGDARLHCYVQVLAGERTLTITWSQIGTLTER